MIHLSEQDKGILVKIYNDPPYKMIEVILSDELCDFLEVPHGTRMGEVDATTNVIGYIWDNDLPITNGFKFFTPDEKLCKLFGLSNDAQDIPYYDIQKHISHHFSDPIYVPNDTESENSDSDS